MEKLPEENKQQGAISHFQVLKSLLQTIDQSGDFVDLNRKAGEKRTESDKFIETEEILQVERLRDASKKLKESLDDLPESEKTEAEKSLIKTDLYLAAHDENRERLRKGMVLLRPKESMTAQEVLEEMEKRNLRSLSIEELNKLVDDSDITWPDWKDWLYNK
jgi:hypothetical protein